MFSSEYQLLVQITLANNSVKRLKPRLRAEMCEEQLKWLSFAPVVYGALDIGHRAPSKIPEFAPLTWSSNNPET